MNIQYLTKDTLADASILGGKGANLVSLLAMGCTIPDCIAITTNAIPGSFERTLSELWHKHEFRFAAVRSSATVEDSRSQSFAGMFSTYLYVTEANLIEKINQCKSSLTLPRVAEYLKRQQISAESIGMAVLVQKMVNSEISGVCFTRNPVTGNSDDIVIEAIFGQGELLVSGQVTPDNYTVSKKSERITARNIGTQKIILTQEKHTMMPLELSRQAIQKLSDIQIMMLSLQAKKIEQAYGSPVDIEWAVEKGKLYFLQVRPITA